MNEPRRAAILPIDLNLLADVLRGYVSLDLPSDLQIVGVTSDFAFRSADLAVSSSTFEPLVPGERFPRLQPLCCSVYNPDTLRDVIDGKISVNEGRRRIGLAPLVDPPEVL